MLKFIFRVQARLTAFYGGIDFGNTSGKRKLPLKNAVSFSK
jgi:hypothetical protein